MKEAIQKGKKLRRRATQAHPIGGSFTPIPQGALVVEITPSSFPGEQGFHTPTLSVTGDRPSGGKHSDFLCRQSSSMGQGQISKNPRRYKSTLRLQKRSPQTVKGIQRDLGGAVSTAGLDFDLSVRYPVSALKQSPPDLEGQTRVIPYLFPLLC